MPVVDKATHIGITRSDTNSARTTVDENIRKARRATYSLMGTGLHGENGLDPETSISLLKTYILPILTYGLEIVIPKGNILDDIQNYYKKLLKQLLSLTINVADPAVLYDIRTITSGSRDTYQGFYNVRQYYKSA
jgi:hypothetical protein